MKTYCGYTSEYVSDICTALNQSGYNIGYRGAVYSPSIFDTLTEFLQEGIVVPRAIYYFLDKQGLVNRGKCPYTGLTTNSNSPKWTYMRERSIIVSGRGMNIMKREAIEKQKLLDGLNAYLPLHIAPFREPVQAGILLNKIEFYDTQDYFSIIKDYREAYKREFEENKYKDILLQIANSRKINDLIAFSIESQSSLVGYIVLENLLSKFSFMLTKPETLAMAGLEVIDSWHRLPQINFCEDEDMKMIAMEILTCAYSMKFKK